MPSLATLLALTALSGAGGSVDGERELARIAKLTPAAACPRLEELLAQPDLDEASRRTALVRLRDFAQEAAPPLTESEAALVSSLEARSLPFVEPLLSRYAIVLGSPEFLDHARAARLPGLIDATYVVLRLLYAVDPVGVVGHRYVLFPDAGKPHGWSIQTSALLVAYGRANANQGGWDDAIAHEISHGFGQHHPAGHLFAGGFFEGYGDLSMAYVGERLGFLGEGLTGRWDALREDILATGEREYIQTRLSIEEIVAYGPSASVVLRLCLDAGNGRDQADWSPLARLFRSTLDDPPAPLPGYLWPARMARDLLRAFPGDRTWDTLSRWRFPLDLATHKSLDLASARPADTTPVTRERRWEAEGQTLVRAWRVLGPIPVPAGRWPNLDYDPLDAWNFSEREEHDVAGVKHRWRDDLAVGPDGVVPLGLLPGAGDPSVFYLRADLPPEAEGPITLYVAGDDECAVWIDGQLVHAFREGRGTDVDDPGRAFALAARGGSRILVQVANYGGPTGFHLRWSKGTPFESTLRVELRAPDPRRRLMAVRNLGTARAPGALIVPLLATAVGGGSPDVRTESARFLGGRRGDPAAVEALLQGWRREKDSRVQLALKSALEELALRPFEDSADAHRWWRDEGRAWRACDHVEAESAYALRSAFGGYYSNNAGAYGGQHVGRCFGGDPAHALTVVLEVKDSGPHALLVRYASASSERRADVRVRRGEVPAAARDGAVFPKTESWETWTWQEIALGVLPPGRYRVEISKVDGCLDLDVLGLRPK